MAVPIAVEAREHLIRAGTPVALFQTQLAAPASNFASETNLVHQYAVAPDGRFLLTTTDGDALAPITVVLNWQEALKPRVPTR